MRQRLAASIVTAAAVLAAGVARSSPAQQPAAPQPTAPAVGRFAYVTGSCADVIPPYCNVATGLAWTPAETSTLDVIFQEITSSEHGRLVVTRALALWGTAPEIRRFGVCLSPTGIVEPIAASRYVYGQTHFFFLCDSFFRQNGLRDRHSGSPGYRLQAEIMAHELFHVVDQSGRRFSRAGNEFAELVGLRPVPGYPGAWIPTDITAPEAAENDRVRLNINRIFAADIEAAIDASRTYALGFRLKSFPSLVAMTSPSEAFAEIGAHLLLDPTARQYLDADVVAYFDHTVFPSLR